jgi:hypothetical protein
MLYRYIRGTVDCDGIPIYEIREDISSWCCVSGFAFYDRWLFTCNPSCGPLSVSFNINLEYLSSLIDVCVIFF